mgnify:CR=1 FL=1
MTKKELIDILKKCPDDVDIYVHVAYNTYSIRQIVNWGDFAVINAGEAVNPESFNDEPDVA